MLRARLVIATLVVAPASWAQEQKLGLDVDASIGPSWALAGACTAYGCAVPPTVALRVGYDVVPFASVGLRAAAVLGPTGRDYCPGPTLCKKAFRAWSVLVDGRLHTLGTLQLTFDTAFGLTRLISLQCGCEEVYQTTGSRLPTLQFALGGRAYLSHLPIHLGLEARYSAMFGADSAYSDVSFGRRIPQSGLVVSSIAVALVAGTSL
jgi:hypothetical protein